LQRSFLSGKLLKGLLISTVGREPDLAANFGVVVVEWKLGYAERRLDGAWSKRRSRKEIGVIEAVVAYANFNSQGSNAGIVAV
jgi:hypothetical protein